MTINTVSEYENTNGELYRVGNDFMTVYKIYIEGYGTQITIDYYKYYAETETWTRYGATSGDTKWSEKQTNLSEDEVLYDSNLDLRFIINYPEKPDNLGYVVNKGDKEDLYISDKKYECTIYTTPDNECQYHICVISGLQHTLKLKLYGAMITITEYKMGGVSFPTFPGEIPDLP